MNTLGLIGEELTKALAAELLPRLTASLAPALREAVLDRIEQTPGPILVDVNAAGALLGVDPATVRRMARKGTITAVRLHRNTVRYSMEQLRALAAGNLAQAGS